MAQVPQTGSRHARALPGQTKRSRQRGDASLSLSMTTTACFRGRDGKARRDMLRHIPFAPFAAFRELRGPKSSRRRPTARPGPAGASPG